jgi:predicted transcriptional regulator
MMITVREEEPRDEKPMGEVNTGASDALNGKMVKEEEKGQWRKDSGMRPRKT